MARSLAKNEYFPPLVAAAPPAAALAVSSSSKWSDSARRLIVNRNAVRCDVDEDDGRFAGMDRRPGEQRAGRRARRATTRPRGG